MFWLEYGITLCELFIIVIFYYIVLKIVNFIDFVFFESVNNLFKSGQSFDQEDMRIISEVYNKGAAKLLWNKKFHRTVWLVCTFLNFSNLATYIVLSFNDSKNGVLRGRICFCVIITLSFMIFGIDIYFIYRFIKGCKSFSELLYKNRPERNGMRLFIIFGSYIEAFFFFIRTFESNIYRGFLGLYYVFSDYNLNTDFINQWAKSPFHAADTFFRVCSNILSYAIGQMVLIILFTLANNTLDYMDQSEILASPILSENAVSAADLDESRSETETIVSNKNPIS